MPVWRRFCLGGRARLSRPIACLLLVSCVACYSFANPPVDDAVTARAAAAGATTAERPADINQLKLAYRRPDVIPFPAGNAYTAEAAILGRTLFFDARLSGSGSLACSSCHNPSFGWEDGLRLGHGEGLRDLDRHSPTILDSAWGTRFFWDGRASSLETQAVGPISAPREMNADLQALPSRIASIAGYRTMFGRAFPDRPIDQTTIVAAIATFERTIVSGKARFDLWVDGDAAAIDDSAKRGFGLFTGKGRCALCHTGWRFSDGEFHDIGLPDDDVGRGRMMPGQKLAMHAFKTPTLRNVARRAPFMHDGSIAALRDVIGFYASGGTERPSRSPLIGTIELNDNEVTDLEHFLGTLSEPARSFPTPTLPQ